MAFIFCITMIRNKPASSPSISAASEKMLILPSFKRAFCSIDCKYHICLVSFRILEVFLNVGLWVILNGMSSFYLYLIFGYKTQLLRLEMKQKQAAAA